MTIKGWQITTTPTAIICHRESRTVLIPMANGKPKLDWRTGFGALGMTRCTTWMNPQHVEAILREAV